MARDNVPFRKEKIEIISCKSTNPKKAMKLSLALRKKAREAGDNQQAAVAEYYAGECAYAAGDYGKCIEIFSKAIPELHKFNRKDILTDAYNLRGISNIFMGDNQGATTDFLMGMSCTNSTKRRLLMESNIGVLYSDFGNYKEAYKYFERVYRKTVKYYNFDTGVVSPNRPDISLIVVFLNMAEVLTNLERYDEALQYLDMIERYVDVFHVKVDDQDENMMSCKICRTKIAFGQQDLKEAMRLSMEILEALQHQNLGADTIRDAQKLIPKLTKYGFLKQAKIMLDNVYENASRYDTNAHWTGYYTCAIDYYKAEQNIAKLIECYDQYFYYANEKEAEYNKKFVKDIETKISLEKIRTKQQESEEKARHLKLLSETDGLTGVLNRFSMNKICENLFKKAQLAGTTFGLMLFDVDCFKEFNDTYGHVAGDECLKAVSAVLNGFSDDNHYIARYGGDEFLLMAYDQTNEAMEQTANAIRSQIHDLQIEHKNSKNEEKIVSITIGVANHIPEEEETVLDEIQMTDEALYTAKKTKRGSISCDFS